MRFTVRATLAVVLLVGVYLLGIGMVVVLAVTVYETATHGLTGYALAKVAMLGLVVAVSIGRGLSAGFLRIPSPEEGVPLVRSVHPRLWGEIDALATRVGTRPPDELWLVPEVTAAVSEDSRWLGLVPGPRKMYVGMPLLVGLTERQLGSVLAHELGHYSGRHTALGGVSYRGAEAIRRVAHRLGPGSIVGRIFGAYGRVYVAVSHTVNRRQELEADAQAARIAGRDVAVKALQESVVIDAAFDEFMGAYGVAGQAQGLRPAELFNGFVSFWSDDQRRTQLASLRAAPPAPAAPSLYDSHPSTEQRIAYLDALPDDGRADESPAAVHLLDHYNETVASLEDWIYQGSGLTAMPWDELVRQSAGAAAHHDAAMLIDAAGRSGLARPSLGSVLDEVGGGAGHRLVRPLFETDPSTDEAREAVEVLVAALLASALVGQGAATHRMSWSALPTLVDSTGADLDLASLVNTTVGDPAAAQQLKEALLAEGIAMDFTPGAGPVPWTPDAAEPLIHAVAVCVQARTLMRIVFVTDIGIAVKKIGVAEGLGLGLRQGTSDPYRAALRLGIGLSVPELSADRRTRIVPWAEIRAVDIRTSGRVPKALRIETVDGSLTRVRVAEGRIAGDLLEALERFARDRLVVH